jgi:serine/threonine-protein kinase
VLSLTQPAGGPVTSYQIAATGLASRTVPPDKATVTIDVPDCTSRSFTVTAVGPGGSTPSAAVDAVGCVTPGAVRDATVTANGRGARTVTWDPPADLGGDAQVDYVLTITQPGRAATTVTASAASYALVCRPDGACPAGMSVAIQARNSVGSGPRTRVAIPADDPSPTAVPS